MKAKNNITKLFNNAKENENYINVCAPMVRYSKVQFRTLVRKFVLLNKKVNNSRNKNYYHHV